MKLPKHPWKLAYSPDFAELEKMRGQSVEAHTGYTRANDGSWIIVDAEGVGIATVNFQGKAKRGEAWTAPDPQGQAIATIMAAGADMLELLKQSQESIGGDWRDRRDKLLAEIAARL